MCSIFAASSSSKALNSTALQCHSTQLSLIPPPPVPHGLVSRDKPITSKRAVELSIEASRINDGYNNTCVKLTSLSNESESVMAVSLDLLVEYHISRIILRNTKGKISFLRKHDSNMEN